MGTTEPARVVVRKAERALGLYAGDALLAEFRVALGCCPAGPKQASGDGRTPEGVYRVCVRNEQSKYHRSLGLDYPGDSDAERGLAAGLITVGQYEAILHAHEECRRPPWGTPLGGEIMIHGGGAQRDWTAGCVALENADMDFLWEHVPLGTEVRILP